MKKVILPAALALFFVQSVQAGQERTPLGEARVFVPNNGLEYVHLEVLGVDKKASSQAKKVLAALEKEVMKYFHTDGPGDNAKNYAKCVVNVHQLSRRDVPAYRLECWSIKPNGERPRLKMGEAASPQEVLQFNKEFAQEHFKRMQPIPMNDTPRPRPIGRSRLA